VAFAIGLRCLRRIDMAASLVFVASNLVCQAFSDPQLGLSALPTLAPIASAFVVIGVLLRVRSTAVEVLRVRTTELREQRERNAQLAVEADQARIAADLDDFLRDRVTQMAHDAAVGRAALESDPERAAGAFIAIQHTGRDTLMRMRGVVATLRDTAMVEPQPVLAQLDRLLGRSAADTRLHVCGDPRLLSPGVELSGYRIVEHLLVALDNDPAAHIDVRVTFGADALKLDVSGPPAPRGDARAALAAATERVATHGGTLRTRATVGRRETVVLIPLASNGHA
jgi:signal transduction histidine kinase